MIRLQNNSSNRLITAYNLMMAEMRNAFNQKNTADMSLQKALDLARQEAIHLGEISAAEAVEISEYIKRDINDAAEFMMDTKAEFYDWLMLDIEVIERKVIDLFLSVADHTRVELEQFRQTEEPANKPASELVPIYRTGEITGPGTLICESCGKTNAFHSSDAIKDCSQCGHHRYIRR